MKNSLRSMMARAPVLASMAAFIVGIGTAPVAAREYPAFVHVASQTNTPEGWVQFCQTYEGVCNTRPMEPRDVVLDDKAWKALVRVNAWANGNIKPTSDMDHYGMIQWWRYPDDGAGACHSYALLKRRILMQAGWPRSALLLTIVHERNGEGHAVLTVKTNKGDYILDNLTDKILVWSQTSYRYYKRQSQSDPNRWVWLDDSRWNDGIMTSSLH
jgi:predicted transglutaminase-like cysteine proteinase